MCDPISLRPHHLLCLQNFVGEGYSGGFTTGMAGVHKRLMADPSARIRLKEGTDQICAGCPNRAGDVCTSGKPDRYDKEVLERTGLAVGDCLTWQEALEKALPLNRDCLPEICGDCQWFSLCDSLKKA